MDIRKIKTLIEMLEESNLNEIEVSQGDESVRISKGKDPLDYIENNQINTSISSQEKVSINEDDTRKFVGNQVKAPLVGTFYRKPSPDSDPNWIIAFRDITREKCLTRYYKGCCSNAE